MSDFDFVGVFPDENVRRKFYGYLGSKKRRKRFKNSPSNLSLWERLREVHHADVENFKHDNRIRE